MGVDRGAAAAATTLFGYDPGVEPHFAEDRLDHDCSYTYNNVNQLISPGPASYDKDGQPLTLGNATYKWDAAGRLISVASGSQHYKIRL